MAAKVSVSLQTLHAAPAMASRLIGTFPGRHGMRCLATSAPTTAAPPARWHADLKARLGKCIIFGCSPAQVQQAAIILRVLGSEWRSLMAGAEGFLTGGRRGLEGQAVQWGEMDSFVSACVRVHPDRPHVATDRGPCSNMSTILNTFDGPNHHGSTG